MKSLAAIARRLDKIEAMLPAAGSGLIPLGRGMAGVRLALTRLRESEGTMAANGPRSEWGSRIWREMLRRRAPEPAPEPAPLLLPFIAKPEA